MTIIDSGQNLYDDHWPPTLDPFFGERWDAPILDGAGRVPTPVGDTCFHCTEPIADGDRGFIRSVVRLVDGALQATAEPAHAECDLYGVIGHMVGVCTCTGYETLTRDAARLVWERAGMDRNRSGDDRVE